MMELKEYWERLTGFQKLKLVLKIILGILVLLFCVFNWHQVELHLLFAKWNLPLTILIVLCLITGFLLSSIFDYRRFKKKDKEIIQLQKDIERLKGRLDEE